MPTPTAAELEAEIRVKEKAIGDINARITELQEKRKSQKLDEDERLELSCIRKEKFAFVQVSAALRTQLCILQTQLAPGSFSAFFMSLSLMCFFCFVFSCVCCCMPRANVFFMECSVFVCVCFPNETLVFVLCFVCMSHPWNRFC